jgi:hypothetical protein
VRRSTEPHCPHAGHEKVSQGNPAAIAATDRGVEPQRPSASLPRVPDSDDLMSFRDHLALGLGALSFGRSSYGDSLAFLRSAVRSHGCRIFAFVSEKHSRKFVLS